MQQACGKQILARACFNLECVFVVLPLGMPSVPKCLFPTEPGMSVEIFAEHSFLIHHLVVFSKKNDKKVLQKWSLMAKWSELVGYLVESLF